MTEYQKQVVEAYLKCGSYRGAAKLLGKDPSNLRKLVKQLEGQGDVPWRSKAPNPNHLAIKSSTVQFDADGNVVKEWRRQHPNIELMQDVVDGLCEQVKGKAKVSKIKKSRKTGEDVLFEIDLFDAHVGMYADEIETLDSDYNCDIAAHRMIEATQALAGRANNPSKCVLVFGGDMLHVDDRSNRTPASGHALDADSRYHRIVSYVIAACRECVEIASTIAPEIEIVVLEGNHSSHSELWLARVLEAYYSDCSNVEIKTTPNPRKHLIWGDNLLLWAHGDKIAAQKWALIIAAEFAKEWGATKYRHLKCGHVHHKKSIAPVVIDEQSGLVVEYLEALCATDAWHAGAGFVGSQKGASAFEYHKTEGLLTRHFKTV
mgnify:CR=1 FL=1|tara:strand:+ start:295 stop:1419 length:1125 start_codon:yes stop_codon:yes gene_type:complete